MKSPLLTSMGMLAALSGVSSLACAHEADRGGEARQRSAHRAWEDVQESVSGEPRGMLAVPATAGPGEPGHGWRYFSNSTAGTAVVISPRGEYYFSSGDGLRPIAMTQPAP